MAKRVLLIQDRSMLRLFANYIEALQESGVEVEKTTKVDYAADEMDMRGFDLILIQFAYLTSPKHHLMDQEGGAAMGGIVANILRKRGITLPIFLLNLGVIWLAEQYADSGGKIRTFHLVDCLPSQLAERVCAELAGA